MKEYNLIINFYYKNEKYQLLVDNDNKYFFLKVINNKFSYVSLDEYVDLYNIFLRVPLCLNAVKDNKKLNVLPKIIIGGMAFTLTISSIPIIGALLSYKNMQNSYNENIFNSSIVIEQQLHDNISFVEDEELIVDTIVDSKYSDYVYIYDMSYLNDYLSYKTVSKAELLNVLNNNNKISDKFKIFISEFIDNLYNKYPDIDMRVFYENLKTLEIVECDKNELTLKSLSLESSACYVRSENIIYTLKDYEYKKGTWEYQVIMHELSHVVRNGWFKANNYDLRVSSTGNSLSLIIVDEALNSLFTVGLFEYQERDIAYQLQSNYFSVMLECLDNYSLSDYINHSLSYFAKKLDEYNGDDNYAKYILTLIDTQYKDFHSSEITGVQEDYYPIYDYISNMYFKKYINDSMSYNQAKDVVNLLIDKITYDVPEEYNIDINRIYDTFNDYCTSIGIDIVSNKKVH